MRFIVCADGPDERAQDRRYNELSSTERLFLWNATSVIKIDSKLKAQYIFQQLNERLLQSTHRRLHELQRTRHQSYVVQLA